MSVTTLAERFLTPPRTARRSPITAVHVHGSRMRGGAHYGYHVWLILDASSGHLVEVHAGDDSIEERIYRRWPWLSTQWSDRFGVTQITWPLGIVAESAELRRLAGLEPFAESAAKLRAGADRRERFAEVRAAVNRIQREGIGTDDFDGSPRYAVIYHRTREHGGDAVSEHLRAALLELERAGMVERLETPELMPDGRTPARDYVSQYRATDTTPAFR